MQDNADDGEKEQYNIANVSYPSSQVYDDKDEDNYSEVESQINKKNSQLSGYSYHSSKQQVS